MQNKILKHHKLLDKSGKLIEPGYATSLLLDYNRENITASKLLIKEWDYYLIKNDDFGLALTIADNGYMGLGSVIFLDFKNKTTISKNISSFMPLGKLKAPKTSKKGDWKFESKNLTLEFNNNGKARFLKAKVNKFDGNDDLEAEIILFDYPKHSMVIATPFFEKPNKFYYNQKINCMATEGKMIIGDKLYKFGKESLATLDWGRGVWSHNNTWYWGSMSTRLDNFNTFGFNIGYGFGNTKAASENMLFYNGICHKLDEIKFNIPKNNKKEDFMSPWTFTSNDKRFEFNFVPILDRSEKIDIGFMGTNQHQVFGLFTGTAILDDGTKIEIKDKLGFAEKVHNKW